MRTASIILMWYHSGAFDINGRKFAVNEVWQRVME